MQPVQLIAKKRDGGEHSLEELRYWIGELTGGRLEAYHLGAWLMACWFRGFSPVELNHLTQVMLESGAQVDLSGLSGVTVDKHSTGGVGDGTSLVIAPLVAAAGGRLAKMSGRGLGHTGGTLDKLEAIPGFRIQLSQSEFLAQVERIGLAIIGQSPDLVPADGLLYAMRDVTATVDSIPLIAASVMSKKLACGAQAILLDVKFGQGAFMKDLAQARELAQAMLAIGKCHGRKTRAVLSRMDEPLGRQVGNALEVEEAIRVLQGEKGPLQEVACELAAHLVQMSSALSLEASRQRVAQLLANGQALERLGQWIAAQGGDPRVCQQPELLPQAAHRLEMLAPRSGYLARISAEAVGHTAMLLGAGRQKKQDPIDPAVGVVLCCQAGDWLEVGQPMARLHYNSDQQLRQAETNLRGAFHWSEAKPILEPLISEVLE